MLYLLTEHYAARRDAQIRFLQAEVCILRKKLKGNRVILDPKDRCHLLRLGKDVRELIVRIATENSQWGYRRIVGELRKLNLSVSKPSVSRILKDEGVYPEPGKGQTRSGNGPWRQSIHLHMNTLVACDFFTKTIVTPLGIRTAYCLFFIHLGSRKVFLAPATYHANASWILRQASDFAISCKEQGIRCRESLGGLLKAYYRKAA